MAYTYRFWIAVKDRSKEQMVSEYLKKHGCTIEQVADNHFVDAKTGEVFGEARIIICDRKQIYPWVNRKIKKDLGLLNDARLKGVYWLREEEG